MTDTLTTLISKIQATLGDDGTIFTTAHATAALRLALDDWNERAPIFAAATVDVVAEQKEYEVTTQDAEAVDIIDVLLKGTDTRRKITFRLPSISTQRTPGYSSACRPPRHQPRITSSFATPKTTPSTVLTVKQRAPSPPMMTLHWSSAARIIAWCFVPRPASRRSTSRKTYQITTRHLRPF